MRFSVVQSLRMDGSAFCATSSSWRRFNEGSRRKGCGGFGDAGAPPVCAGLGAGAGRGGGGAGVAAPEWTRRVVRSRPPRYLACHGCFCTAVCSVRARPGACLHDGWAANCPAPLACLLLGCVQRGERLVTRAPRHTSQASLFFLYGACSAHRPAGVIISARSSKALAAEPQIYLLGTFKLLNYKILRKTVRVPRRRAWIRRAVDITSVALNYGRLPQNAAKALAQERINGVLTLHAELDPRLDASSRLAVGVDGPRKTTSRASRKALKTRHRRREGRKRLHGAPPRRRRAPRNCRD